MLRTFVSYELYGYFWLNSEYRINIFSQVDRSMKIIMAPILLSENNVENIMYIFLYIYIYIYI